MIQQDRIDKDAGDYRDGLLKEKNRTTGQFVGIPPTHKEIEAMVIGYADGMTAGVRFAEIEMGQIIDEYGQWLASMWSDDHAQCHWNPTLYAKFMEERNQQSEPTCPECGSTRILPWPDKYQCRRCDNIFTNPAPDIEG